MDAQPNINKHIQPNIRVFQVTFKQRNGQPDNLLVYVHTGQTEYDIETTSPHKKGRVEQPFSIQNDLQPFGAVDGVYLFLQ